MSRDLTVAVAGAGIAGLAAAASFARRGAQVTVYERSETPREFGAGIYLKENSLPVLEALGVLDRILQNGERIRSARIVDERGEEIVKRSLNGERMFVVLRSVLHDALRDAALGSGVQLVTNTTVAAARPCGDLQFADDTNVSADLVVGADGVNSCVRNSLGLTKSIRALPDGATRLLIPREEGPVACEYWSGDMRLGIAPCSADQSYVFLIGPEEDARCGAVPVDTEYWVSRFPSLDHIFDRISRTAGVHHAHSHVVCHEWVAGRVAVIGDAAHAQPPNLGQGAGIAIAAAWELARSVEHSDTVENRLVDWERRVRPSIDGVQKYTTFYSYTGYYWPKPALRLRSELFHWLSNVHVTARAWEYWWRGGTVAPKPTRTAEGL
jgi:2-polyprenyl-6-methoxyphenol hydroxylase-like FAD-dependent oxidoreductase